MTRFGSQLGALVNQRQTRAFPLIDNTAGQSKRIRNMAKKIQMSKEMFELLVLIAYAHDEISIGKCRDLLGWQDSKIREQAEARVGGKSKRYFLDQDNSGHWHLVEAKYVAGWDQWQSLDENDENSWKCPDFATPLGGSPRITFSQPSDEPV